MGNCLGMQENLIKVMKPDGKILEYKSPIKVHQVLSDFAGHAISDTLSVVRHLWPDTELTSCRLYYLLPLPIPPPLVAEKKRVRFAIPEAESGVDQEKEVVRIKLIISKKELEMILRKGGVVSVDDMVSQLQKEQNSDKDHEINDEFEQDGGRNGSSTEGWKPVLESIPEVY